jgi:hypothetical protein
MVIVSTLDIFNDKYFLATFLHFFLRHHTIEVDGSYWQIKRQGLVIQPLLILGLKNHAGDAIKLGPFPVLILVDPGPVELIDISKSRQLVRNFYIEEISCHLLIVVLFDVSFYFTHDKTLFNIILKCGANF